ncbi:uncharacterized protein N7487_000579 [Penicillium crustosum]|uniref:uncharacterized protein n=1 Tax=Penicillium crustosum TaxID=36656 RepID=UPI00238D415D|nr:uncharacterized protein N7487_000579 [Penicillium crustosum]KAJ5417029.1 hypothetical protein N7487_000579 [Penicillium crustosum]
MEAPQLSLATSQSRKSVNRLKYQYHKLRLLTRIRTGTMNMVGTLLDLLRIDEVEMDVISSVYELGRTFEMLVQNDEDYQSSEAKVSYTFHGRNSAESWGLFGA